MSIIYTCWWVASENKEQPSLIFPSGSRLRRSASSVSSSAIPNTVRPKSLIEDSVPKRHSDNYNACCTSKKKNLNTIDEKSTRGENDCYILRIGCNNWVGRWEQLSTLINPNTKILYFLSNRYYFYSLNSCKGFLIKIHFPSKW